MSESALLTVIAKTEFRESFAEFGFVLERISLGVIGLVVLFLRTVALSSSIFDLCVANAKHLILEDFKKL